LRILLTACPTANRTTGGIDIHEEWVSSIRRLLKKELTPTSPLFDYSRIKEAEYEELDLAIQEEFKAENVRHSFICAKFIGQIFLFFASHFESNHLMQYLYLSHLIVDANGVLVLAKFLNQNFENINKAAMIKPPCLSVSACQDPQRLISSTLLPLLHILYRICKGQSERIKSILVQYKAINICRKILADMDDPALKQIIYRVVKIQIKYMDKAWKQGSLKMISNVYLNIELENIDDWIRMNEGGESINEGPNEVMQATIR
jgi:hypothetical protein